MLNGTNDKTLHLLKDFLEKPLARRACLIALAFATMLNLQTLPLGGRLLGLQNGENYSHLTESERCESFLRFDKVLWFVPGLFLVWVGWFVVGLF